MFLPLDPGLINLLARFFMPQLVKHYHEFDKSTFNKNPLNFMARAQALEWERQVPGLALQLKV